MVGIGAVVCLWLFALTAIPAAASAPMTQPAPGSPVFTSLAAGFDNQGTTHFLLKAAKSTGFHGDPTATQRGSIRIRNEPSDGSGAGEGVRTLDPYLGKVLL